MLCVCKYAQVHLTVAQLQELAALFGRTTLTGGYMPEIPSKSLPIFTVGYGNRSVEELIALLEENRVGFLVDVRSAPYSKFKPEFSKDALAARLADFDIRYIFLGNELGGKPNS